MIVIGVGPEVNFRLEKFNKAKADVDRTEAWLESHPEHRLRDEMKMTRIDQLEELERQEKLLERMKIDVEWNESLLDRVEKSFTCLACGKVTGDKQPGYYIHLDCFDMFLKGQLLDRGRKI